MVSAMTQTNRDKCIKSLKSIFLSVSILFFIVIKIIIAKYEINYNSILLGIPTLKNESQIIYDT